MSDAEDLQTDDALRAWDWLAELGRQERLIPWLADKTATNYRVVYRFARGERVPSIAWLRVAARVLGRITAT